MKKVFISLSFILLTSFYLKLAANNLNISNVTLTNDSTISFDISWDNSWSVSSAPYNHDAVWIFVKYRDCASNQWSHADLDTLSSNHTVASPLQVHIDNIKDGKGIFLRRSSDGVGNIATTAVSLRMTNIPAGNFDFKVFGIEMVYVPQGSFQLGDGNTSTGSLKTGSTSNPYQISNENSITVGTGGSNIYTASSTYRPVSPIPAEFPKGFDAFYCMKYEISQGQYAEFLNTLTADQAANRWALTAANRNTISGTWPNFSATAPNRANNYMAWSDLLAYLDWAALRPMTEFEFEKASRGTVTPVAGEYAWGTITVTDGNTLVNDGTNSEGVTQTATAGSGLANYNNTSVLGPIRVGFAATSGTDRLEAGASYYGIMELSGNIFEMVVNTNSTGKAFTGNVGDGVLTVAPSGGFSNETSWPSQTASTASASSAIGRGLKGGAWNYGSTYLRVSDRALIFSSDGRRLSYQGGRGVR